MALFSWFRPYQPTITNNDCIYGVIMGAHRNLFWWEKKLFLESQRHWDMSQPKDRKSWKDHAHPGMAVNSLERCPRPPCCIYLKNDRNTPFHAPVASSLCRMQPQESLLNPSQRPLDSAAVSAQCLVRQSSFAL